MTSFPRLKKDMPNHEWSPKIRGGGNVAEVDNSWPTHKQIHVSAKI